MGGWPKATATDHDNLIEHAERPHHDFEAVDNYVRGKYSSASIGATLPTSLRKRVSAGVEKSLQELITSGTLRLRPSKTGITTFCDTVLRHISNEASFTARDRIPLKVFTALLDSYSELNAKLWAHPAFRQQAKKHTPVFLPNNQLDTEYGSEEEALNDATAV